MATGYCLTTGLPRSFHSCRGGSTVDSQAHWDAWLDDTLQSPKIHAGWINLFPLIPGLNSEACQFQNSATCATLSGPCFGVCVQQSAVLWDLKSLPRPTNTKDATRGRMKKKTAPSFTSPNKSGMIDHGGPRKVLRSGTAFSLSPRILKCLPCF